MISIILASTFNGSAKAVGVIEDDGHCRLGDEHWPTIMAMYNAHRPPEWIMTADSEWELALDPWHADAFAGTPGEGVIGHGGARQLVWMKLDHWGNAIGVGDEAVDGKSPAHAEAEGISMRVLKSKITIVGRP